MNYKYTTQLPNEIVDQYLLHLNQSEIKCLLVIIRQTLGFIDKKTKKRKLKAWITISFFERRSRLSRKSIALALQGLIEKQLIVALDYTNCELTLPKQRRGKRKIYYAYAPYFREDIRKRSVLNLTKKFTYRHNTKPNTIKPKSTQVSIQKQKDYNRCMEIMRQKKERPPNSYYYLTTLSRIYSQKFSITTKIFITGDKKGSLAQASHLFYNRNMDDK